MATHSFKARPPDKFTGKDVDNWCDAMDDYLKSTGLEHADRALYLVASYFQGQAQTWWRYYKDRMLRGAVEIPSNWGRSGPS